MTPVPGHRSMIRSASWRAMVATLLAASAVATPIEAAPQRDTITLNYWTQQVSSRSVGASTEAALKVFEKQNPGIKVHVTTFPYLVFHDKIVTAIRGGQGPDIATLDEPWTPEFAASGTLIPLDSLLASSKVIHRSDFFAGGLTSAEYKGRLWGIPQVSGGWMQFAYNKDMFAKAGITAPPTTWAQFAVDAQKLTRPPAQYAVGLLGDQGEDMVCALNAFINTNGGQIINAAGTKSLINQPAAVQAIRFYTGLAKYAPAGTVGRAQPDALNLFNAGKVAIDMEGPWAQDGYKHGLNWGIAMMPAPQGKSFHA
ncbi:MAG: putative ABC-type sugar transport system, periplasmic component, partial [Chloroflexi bacterium]|nr:putative ABC-type sugar transport system, periplasmic component [Chloroflexota bacterium]